MRGSAVSFAAGLLVPFTVAVVGEEPVGELILVAVAAWALLCLAYNHAWPGALFRRPSFRWMMAAQAAATLAYVAADLCRGSSSYDAVRGWSRMIFLGLDLVAVAYLFGRSPRNFLWLQGGLCLGQVLQAAMQGPLFGDFWKFGLGVPVSYLVLYLAPFGGALAGAAGAAALGFAHFALDYRSEGALCLAVAFLTFLCLARRRTRIVLAPLAAAGLAASVALVYGRTENASRADRSDIERSAMLETAGEAFLESPLLGQGSWFSNSPVYDRFTLLRATKAREEHVGGFARPNSERDDTAFHSQILVALAEGGLVGGAFFLVYGGGLAWALAQILFARTWDRLSPLLLLYILSALWDLLFSPFSGAHRVGIAQAAGLILLLAADRSVAAPTT